MHAGESVRPEHHEQLREFAQFVVAWLTRLAVSALALRPHRELLLELDAVCARLEAGHDLDGTDWAAAGLARLALV